MYYNKHFENIVQMKIKCTGRMKVKIGAKNNALIKVPTFQIKSKITNTYLENYFNSFFILHLAGLSDTVSESCC